MSIEQNVKAIQDGRRASRGLGKLLREFRRANGIDQVDMARRLGISSSYLCDIELGRRTLGPQKLARLQKVLADE